MAKHMKLMGVAGAILLAIGGTAMASNMGFKIVPNLALQDPNVYEISIPLNNNYTDLKSIFDDIGTNCPNGASSVTHFAPDQSSCTWNGPFSCSNPLAGGQAVRVTVAVTGCATWVIVGSHNPSFVYTFPLVDPNIYEISVPYHTTRTNIRELFDEIPNASSISRFHPDQSSCVWNGPFSCSEPITIGEGYWVTVGVAASTWVPSHY